MDLNSDRAQPEPEPEPKPEYPRSAAPAGYDLNSKIMLTAVLSLSFVIILVIILHIYARCVLRHPPRRHRRSTTVLHRHGRHHHHQMQPSAVVDPTTTTTTPKTGLDPAVIKSLPSFVYKKSSSDGSQDKDDRIECAVCLFLVEEDEVARRLPNCDHVFHVACIDRWLSGQSTCPICRSEAAPRLAPHDREPPVGSHRVEVMVGDRDRDQNHDHDLQNNVHSSGNSNIATSKEVANGSGPSSSSSFRLSSFRKMLGRDRSSLSSSSRRIHDCGELLDLERQGH